MTGIAARKLPRKSWIQTHPGRHRFDPMKPDPKVIDIKDIAHALSMLCRFTGHVERFYSVAEHSYHVSLLCDPKEALAGLLHDASEAYLNDISTPVKYTKALAGYRKAEDRLQRAIYKKFGVEAGPHPSVKLADRRILGNEAVALKAPLHMDWNLPAAPYFEYELMIWAWPSEVARAMFLGRYYQLTEENNG